MRNPRETAGNHDTAVTRKLFLITAILACIASVAWSADGPSGDARVSIEPHAEPEASRAPHANIRVDTTLVLIPVTVTDPLNRFVTGLKKDTFKLFEEKKEQEIVAFTSEDAALSIGLVFDCSGSMQGKLEKSREWVAQFFSPNRYRIGWPVAHKVKHATPTRVTTIPRS